MRMTANHHSEGGWFPQGGDLQTTANMLFPQLSSLWRCLLVLGLLELLFIVLRFSTIFVFILSLSLFGLLVFLGRLQSFKEGISS